MHFIQEFVELVLTLLDFIYTASATKRQFYTRYKIKMLSTVAFNLSRFYGGLLNSELLETQLNPLASFT